MFCTVLYCTVHTVEWTLTPLTVSSDRGLYRTMLMRNEIVAGARHRWSNLLVETVALYRLSDGLAELTFKGHPPAVTLHYVLV